MADYNSSLPVRTENPGDIKSNIVDATNPLQGMTVNADGSINITDNGGSLTVDATNLDIRDLVFATDKVDVSGSTITVNSTDFDIRDLDANQDNVAISDGTDTLEVNSDGSINVVATATDLDIRDLNFATDSVEVRQTTHDNLNANANIQVGNADVANGNPVPVSDAGGSLTVDATDFDIRDLTHVSDSVKIGDGTDFLAVNADGSINVVPLEDPGTETVNYNTSAAVAVNASSNHDFQFTTGGRLYQVLSSASGKMKSEIQIETGNGTNTFNTVCVRFNSTAEPDADMDLTKYAVIPTGARVRVIRTNRDQSPQDLYSTIVGIAN